jgi:hypothetical protein
MTNHPNRSKPRKGPVLRAYCPGCERHELKPGPAGVGRAHSRFIEICICSECSVRENREGFFWAELYYRKAGTIRGTQRKLGLVP